MRPLLCTVTLSAIVAGCATNAPTEHIVMFGHDGSPVNPGRTRFLGALLSGYESLDERTEFDGYLNKIRDGIRKFFADGKSPRKVILFIHGGLNTQKESVERAIDLVETIRDRGSYPVFVNWRASLASSYVDHLLFVRQGRRGFGPHNDEDGIFWDTVRLLLSPVQLSVDIVGAAVRFPIVQLQQFEGATEWLGLGRSPERKAADNALKYHPPEPINIRNDRDLPPDNPIREGVEVGAGALMWIVMTPFRIVSTTTIDAGGRGAWDVLRRRVALLFYREAELERPLRYRRPRGLLLFMQKLHDLQQDYADEHRTTCNREEHTECGEQLEITMVGHSMGAIVLNHLLTHSQLYEHLRTEEHEAHVGEVSSDESRELRLPRFTNIVYLAAACSVAEYEEAAFAYLLHDESANVYHVVLHPSNEKGQNTLYDLTPRGSLLTWIDDFLAKPLTLRDRTAGSYSNLVPALHDTPRELRPRVHVRILPWAAEGLPQRHSDFSRDKMKHFKFWNPNHWFSRRRGPSCPNEPS